MIKNIIALTIADNTLLKAHQLDQLEAAISLKEFQPLEGARTKSVGFVHNTESSRFVKLVGDFLVLSFKSEKKSVPAKLVKEIVKQKVIEYMERSGDLKPSDDELAGMHDDAVYSLLPRAFPSQTEALLWIDTKTDRIYIDTGSSTVADDVIAALRLALPDLGGILLTRTRIEPTTLMTKWILDPDNIVAFEVDDRCEMVLPVEGKPTIKYVNHTLTGAEISSYIRDGRIVTSLGLVFDEKMTFQLTHKWIIKSIKLSKELRTSFVQNELDWDGQFLLVANLVKDLDAALIESMSGLLNQEEVLEQIEEEALAA